MIGIDHEVNVTDAAAVGEAVADVAPEAIYHLAALAHVGESWGNPGDVLLVNVIGTAEFWRRPGPAGDRPASC